MTREYLKSIVRIILLKSKIYYFIGPFSNFLLKMIYVSKLVKWSHLHLDPVLNHHYEADVHFKTRIDLYESLLQTHHLDTGIEYLEFGVYRGHSLRWWIENNKHPSSKFVGFDTFSGLPEDWETLKKGTYSAGGQIPDINDTRVSFEVGLFQDTLVKFLKKFSFTFRKVINLDADLYSSTLFVLTSLAPKLKKGDILIFDEFATNAGFTHEFRAFCDFITAYRFSYRLLGAARYYTQIAIEIV